MSTARPTVIRGGQIRPPSFLDDLLSIPFQIYAFLMLFVQSLIDVRSTTMPGMHLASRRQQTHTRGFCPVRSPRRSKRAQAPPRPVPRSTD